MKVFLDTNVLVAAFATRGLCADVVRLALAAHEMVVSETVLSELARALGEKLGLPEREVRSILSFVRQHAMLTAAMASGADVLVTGDRDLLELETPAPIRIVSPRGFWQLAGRRADER